MCPYDMREVRERQSGPAALIKTTCPMGVTPKSENQVTFFIRSCSGDIVVRGLKNYGP